MSRLLGWLSRLLSWLWFLRSLANVSPAAAQGSRGPQRSQTTEGFDAQEPCGTGTEHWGEGSKRKKGKGKKEKRKGKRKRKKERTEARCEEKPMVEERERGKDLGGVDPYL